MPPGPTKTGEADGDTRLPAGVDTRILDAMATHAAILAGDGTILWVNGAWRRFARQNDGPSEHIGVDYLAVCRTGAEASVPRDEPAPGTPWARRAAEGLEAILGGDLDHVTFTYPCHAPDVLRWFSFEAVPLETEAGRLALVLHHQAEEAPERIKDRRTAGDRLATAVDHAPVILFVLDPEGRFTLSQGAGLAPLGLGPGEVVGLHVQDVYAEHPGILAAVDQALAGQNVSEHLHVQGRHFDVHMTPAIARDGGIAEVVGLAVDVTEQTQARESRDRFHEILQALPELVGTCTPDGQVLYLNPAFQAMAGVGPDQSPEELTIKDFHPPETLSRLQGQAIPYAVENGSWTGQGELLSEDGGTIPIRQTILAHRDSEGELSYLSTLIQDLRPEERLRDEVARRAHAQARADELESVLAMASHTLLTQVRHLISFSQMIDRDGELPPATAEAAGFIKKAGHRLHAQLGALATYAELLTQPRRTGDHDLEALLGEVVDHYPEAEVSLDLEEGLQIHGDAHQLTELLSRLVSNAVKFQTGTPPQVEIQARAMADRLHITVSDQGPGFDPAYKERVFELFEQLDPATEGVGVGLPLARALAELHDGKVALETTPGKGTVAHVRLPRTGPG